MSPSARVEYPDPCHLSRLNPYSKEANKSVLNILHVSSLHVCRNHHVEKQKSNEHEELLKTCMIHFNLEEFTIRKEEICFLYFLHSTHVDHNELPGYDGNHEYDAQEESCIYR